MSGLVAGRPGAEIDPSERAAARPSPAAGTTIVIVSHDDRLREVADRVLWLEDGFQTLQALARDLNCGILIDPDQPAASVEVDGERLSFCAVRAGTTPPSAGSASDHPRQSQASVLR